MSRKYLVPIELPADPVNALEAATKQYVDASSGGVSNNVAYTLNATTTAPPASGQVRLNNTTQNSATILWAHNITTDGLDVSVGFARLSSGYQIYLQDADSSANWRLYNVTATPTDSGVYWSVPIAYHSGSVSSVPTGAAVQLQSISPVSHGVPSGGFDGDVLTKSSNDDYAIGWEAPDYPYISTTRVLNVSTPITITDGGVIDAEPTIGVTLFDDDEAGVVVPSGSFTGKVLIDDNSWFQLVVAVDDVDWPPASPVANTLYLHLAP